jgi:hypothetical protein
VHQPIDHLSEVWGYRGVVHAQGCHESEARMNEQRYHLTVTVEEENPQYEEQRIEYERRQQYMGSDFKPERIRTVNRLDVTVTHDEFAAIKRAVLETFK